MSPTNAPTIPQIRVIVFSEFISEVPLRKTSVPTNPSTNPPMKPAITIINLIVKLSLSCKFPRQDDVNSSPRSADTTRCRIVFKEILSSTLYAARGLWRVTRCINKANPDVNEALGVRHSVGLHWAPRACRRVVPCHLCRSVSGAMQASLHPLPCLRVLLAQLPGSLSPLLNGLRICIQCPMVRVSKPSVELTASAESAAIPPGSCGALGAGGNLTRSGRLS